MTSLFRKHNTPKPLHTRWGDVAISTPTDGAWNQYSNPHNTLTYPYTYGPGFIPAPEHPSTPRTHQHHHQHQHHQQPSFSRRLSMRLAPRSRTRSRASGAGTISTNHTSNADDDVDADEQPLLARQSHFAYRPIQQDYLREIESAVAVAPRDVLPGRVSPRSSCGSSSLASSEDGSRRFSLGVGPEGEEGGWRVGGGGVGVGGRRRSSGSGSGSGSSLSSSSSSAGKKRFSARRMTMTMVPDAEDIYG